jgi:phosphatidylglycerol:prolipoprotein diacylglycerol transferase
MNEFIQWWQHLPENINPNLISIGPFQIRYYGLMYLLGFATVYLLLRYRIKHESTAIEAKTIADYFFWMIPAVLIGGRLGYVLFYNLGYYLTHPLEIFLPFEFSREGLRYIGIYGMSYHGALVAVICGSIFFCRKNKIDFWKFTDLVVPAIPLGYTFGRIGNFINGELYGRPTSCFLGMYFPGDPTGQLRHVSQLYEAFFEGIFLFIIFWNLRKNKKFTGILFPAYLIGYGVVRFFVEFLRQPDVQLGFIFGWLTMGQILCLAMIASGLVIAVVKKRYA